MFKLDTCFHCEKVAELGPGASRTYSFFVCVCVVHRLPRHALEIQLFLYGFTSHEAKPLCTAYVVLCIELMPSVTSRFLGHDFTKHSALFPSVSSHRTHSSLPYAKHCCTYANQNLSNYVNAGTNLSTNS